MEPRWKLGDDMISSDNILDGITFDDIILAVHCNCQYITPAEVIRTALEIVENRTEDFCYILNKNLEEICAEARKGRE